MAKPAVLVIDVGTSVLKTTLFDYRCRSIDRADRPHPNPGADLSIAARQWWDSTLELVRQLGRRNAGYHVEAIGLTGFMHAVIAVDGAGEPLRFHSYPENVYANFDALIDRFGVRELYALTGSRMDPTSVPPHITAWREMDPASFAQVKMILPVKDFLRYRLTGSFATDPIDAGGTMLFALHRKLWDPALLDCCGLDASQVPPVLSCTAVAGSLTAAAAEALQLTAGIPVSVGAIATLLGVVWYRVDRATIELSPQQVFQRFRPS